MSEDERLYIARIIENATDEVVRQSEPTYRRRAEKIADGMGINLNWDRFTVEVVEVEKEKNG